MAKPKGEFVRVGRGVSIKGKPVSTHFFRAGGPGARFAHRIPDSRGDERIHVRKIDLPEIAKEHKRWFEGGAIGKSTIIRGRDVAKMSPDEIKAFDAEILTEGNRLATELGEMQGLAKKTDKFKERQALHTATMEDLRNLRGTPFYEGGREINYLPSSWSSVRRRLRNNK
jgi:hypothetical protein